MRPMWLGCALLFVTLVSLSARAADDKSPDTVAVAQKTFRVEVTLDGTVEAKQMVELAVRPQAWEQLVVAEAVPHGAHVARGQLVLRLDTTKIDLQIRDAQAARELALLAIKQSEEQVRLLAMSTPIDLELAERAHRIAGEDLARFLQIDAPLAKKTAAFRLKSAEQYLEYNLEELRQLEKMYKADDLTEETEEIILKRARNDVEQSKFQVESARVEHDTMLKVLLPREEQDKQNALRSAALAAEKARSTLPLALAKERLELARLQLELRKGDEQLARLQADRGQMTLHAPRDGVIYYGTCRHGKWSGQSEAASKLRAGGEIQPHEVLLTLVDGSALEARVTVPEADLAWASVGATGHMRVPAFPKLRLPVTLRSRSAIPVAEGQFEATFDLTGPAAAELVSGMACEVRLLPYVKANALVLPAKSVFVDEIRDDQHYVYVLGSGDKPTRKVVEVGHKSGDEIEILGGLAAGDKVLAEKPKSE